MSTYFYFLYFFLYFLFIIHSFIHSFVCLSIYFGVIVLVIIIYIFWNSLNNSCSYLYVFCMIWTMQEPVCCMDIKAGRAPALPREGIYNQKKKREQKKSEDEHLSGWRLKGLINESVTGILGLQKRFQKVQLCVPQHTVQIFKWHARDPTLRCGQKGVREKNSSLLQRIGLSTSCTIFRSLSPSTTSISKRSWMNVHGWN